MRGNIEELLAYLDRLIALEKTSYACTREISECIDAIRVELALGEFEDRLPRKSVAEIQREIDELDKMINEVKR